MNRRDALLGSSAALTVPAARYASILTFHALEDAADPICFAPGIFRRGLDRLIGSGFRACPLEELAAYASGDGCFPARSFAVTFDDGYQSVYREALPVLQELCIPATVFLAVGRPSPSDSATRLPVLSGRTMLNWGQIREMHRAGISFGAHTLTHPDLTRLSSTDAEAEIRDSQAMLEDALGTRVRTFAYPYGRFDSQSREIVRRNFDLACSDRLGLVSAGCDVYALCRVDTYYLRSDRLFATLLTPFFPEYVAARAVPRRLRRALAAHLER